MIDKPVSPSCERNREPILMQLREHFADRRRVLEIGSGTGEHALHFAAAMPWLTWQCSDREENLPGIHAWLNEAALPNAPVPVELDVTGTWRFAHPFDAAFSANTLHIMSWREVEAFFAGLATALADDARLVVYGPFNYNGAFTSDSNAEFNEWLKARDPNMGIRNFEAVDALARASGLQLHIDTPMPANNRLLVWRRQAGSTVAQSR